MRPSHHLAPGPLYDEFDDKPRTRRMGKRNIKAQVSNKGCKNIFYYFYLIL